MFERFSMPTCPLFYKKIKIVKYITIYIKYVKNGEIESDVLNLDREI